MALSASTVGARADDNDSFLSKFLQSIGWKTAGVTNNSGNDINYTERPPLVVPPTRDLPPPSDLPAPTPDWPRDAPIKHQKAAKGRIVPVQPAPNGAAPVTTGSVGAQAAPQPPEKTGFFNSLFNKEEYATFNGEPVRENLTDPPVGYRTPSPNQPYGIGPERKADKPKTAADGTEITTPGTQPSSSPGR